MDAGLRLVIPTCRPEYFGSRPTKTIRLIIDRNRYMKFLGYAYRFLSNFVFLALVYYSLNSMDKYQQRAVLAILVLAYAVMRAATALRSFISSSASSGSSLRRAVSRASPGMALPRPPHVSKSSMTSRFCAGTAK